MPINILMPALSPTMETGNLAKWLVKEGDSVTSGDIIAEIETDKATMEVESIDEGIIGKILVAEGTDDVPVNDVIAVLLEDGESAGDINVPVAPAVSKVAENASTAAVAIDGVDKKIIQPKQPANEGVTATPAPNVNPSTGSGTNRVFSSPLARRLAKQNGLDVASITGSGPRGRVVKRDVDAAMAAGTGKAVTSATAAAPVPKAKTALATGPSDEMIFKLYEEGSYDLVPHDNMRRVIAKRLTESKQTVPHFYLTVECELDALLDLRKQVNASASVDSEGKPAFKISVNDMVIKAQALALRDIPKANASWTDSGMMMHKTSDVGVAVSIEGGLITPIVRGAENKTLSVISREMKDYATRARSRKLLPHEYQGGTTAISNLGMFGIKEFSAVINPPHATILAVGAGQQRPIVRDGALAIATIMSVTLSTDHRAVDGALGAELISAFKKYIENPMGLLV
ncbi:MAG: pyruvate dehydrogenase complex dihydrolipoamide acetyltransferase [Cohaesibacteraceae bacterium]|nr:pyruvate dehydrogenase complex dihydrolipoamide acetyltransferase [Cohaesibacteraceae bacterium]